MHTAGGILWLVYRGPDSRAIAETIAQRVGAPVFALEDADGLDRHRCLFIYDAGVKRPRWAMRNQGNCNRQEFPCSVEIHQGRYARAIINQVVADYFTQFERNLGRWGLPWGARPANAWSPTRPKEVTEMELLLRRFGLLRETDLAPALRWAEQGEPATLFAMVCPDYSFSYDARRQALRYDGTNCLGSGVGLIARRTLAFLDAFTRIPLNPRPRILIGIADYEDEPANLQRLAETADSFAAKIRGSISALYAACRDRGIEAHVVGLREFFGRAAWQEEWTGSMTALDAALEAMTLLARARLLDGRRKLFERWYPGISMPETRRRLVRQSAEYTACGYLLGTRIHRPLVLGTNSIDMGWAYRLRAPALPVAYISRAYA